MTTSIWTSPARGTLLNSGQPWKRGDTADVQLSFSSPPDTLQIIGGSLPPGLYFNATARKIQGTVTALPKTQTSYPLLFRATKIVNSTTELHDRSFVLIVNPLDEQQKFTGDATLQSNEATWLAGLYTAGGSQTVNGDRIHYLGSLSRGQTANIQLQIDNPDNDLLTYKVIGYANGTNPKGLPLGLEIDDFGRITGAPLYTGNVAGNYFFRIYVRAPNRSEGQPKTSMKVFRLTLTADIVADSRYSDVVRWDTPAGSLGATYETYPSHFSVHASPQYVIQNSQGQETQAIRYTLATTSGNLPTGLVLDPDTGLITGKCPYVSVNTTYTITVQAQVIFINNITGQIRTSTITSRRTFTLTLMSLFLTNSVMSLEFSVPPLERLEIARWIQGTNPELRNNQDDVPTTSVPHMLTILSRDKLFRPQDTFFGRVQNLRITLIRGLKLETGQAFINHLKDYHHPTRLRIGSLASAIALDPAGRHVYDVLYFKLIDPLEGAGGFDSQSHEELLPYGKIPVINSWNMASLSPGFFPNSIKNLRDDLILTTNRLANPGNSETAPQRGIGIEGREGLALWQMTEQTPGNPQSIPGYQPVIELAYLQPGLGPSILKSLKVAGFEDAVSGNEITLDRYLLTSDGIQNTVWDATDETSTTFDGPTNTDTPTQNLTTFDLKLTPVSKYYKFPPGDKGEPR